MRPDPNPDITLIANSFNVEDRVFHGLMALGVLKEIAIKLKGANHKAWSAYMQLSGRFGEIDIDFAAWNRAEWLEYIELILGMGDPAYPLYVHACDGLSTMTDFSEQASREYEHVMNVGASINRPPYAVIRI